MKIIGYNLNGIRSAINKGLTQWLEEENPDILCINETKAQPDQVDHAIFEHLGYKGYWFSAQKKGYSGVAVYTKIEPTNVVQGCGIEEYDNEGRLIQLDFPMFTLICSYFPSGTAGDVRQDFKYQYLRDMFVYLNSLKEKHKKVVLVGDINICHKAIDIHDPKGNKNSSGFLPEEREWMDTFFASGWHDSFRIFHQEPHQYTWWSNRAGARGNNKGWRIDYQAVSDDLLPHVVGADILPEVVHSDHCPTVLQLKF
jgi:exodeoxyribonuclease III